MLAVLLEKGQAGFPRRIILPVFQAAPDRNSTRGSFSLLDGRDWAGRSTTMESLGLYSTLAGGLVFTGGDEARLVETAYVTPGFFETLGMGALHGRFLAPEEEYGDNRLLVLSHGYWLREHGGDPEVVGRSLDMEGQAYRVVGIMPPDFAFPGPEVEAEVASRLLVATSNLRPICLSARAILSTNIR